jgi:hypothetical protein
MIPLARKSGIPLDGSARVPVPQSPSLVTRLTPLAALVLALAAGACHVGESPGDTGDEGSPAGDAGGNTGGDDGADDGEPAADGGGNTGDPCAVEAPEATPQSPTHVVGYEFGPNNQGQGCIDFCHNPDAPDASSALIWSAGGSVYAEMGSSKQPVEGATIVIEEKGSGTRHVAVSSANGQFRFEGEIVYPAVTYACSPETRMVAELTDETFAGCGGRAGCHLEALPIYLLPE